MKMTEATRIVLREVKEILKEAGMVNGRTTTDSKDVTKVKYYYNRGEKITEDGTETIVIYGIASLMGTGRADGENFGYMADVAIDIFTHQDGQSGKIIDLIQRIEDAGLKRGYFLEQDSQETFDGTRVVQRLSYTLSKTVY